MMWGSPVYAAMLALGVLIGTMGWWRMSRNDSRLPLVYFAGLAGAFLGAKLAYLIAEGVWLPRQPESRALWLSGKSIAGALPGGWLGVEVAKKMTGYTRVTGDRFALLLPVPLILGRLGCLHAGCCPGIPLGQSRWPAVPVEIGFQVGALAVLALLHFRKILPGQHFHLYLIAYGVFRFAHEFLRATPKLFADLSGYQWMALVTALGAIVAFRRRSRDELLKGCESAE